jgi:hypothetical protein
MTDDKLRGRIQKSHLPDPVKQHLKLCIEAGKRHRWHDALEEDFETVVQKTLEVVNAACSNTRQNPDTLFRGADFDPSDLDPDRLDAAIAEFRAINHLAREGFQDIELLPAQPGTRTADIICTLRCKRYALDVACSSADAGRSVEMLAAYMLGVCERKERQLQDTKKARACDYAGVIFVVNSEPALVFGYQLLYRRAARQVYEALGSPHNYHIIVVTGREAAVSGGEGGPFVGPDDIVYPDWTKPDNGVVS